MSLIMTIIIVLILISMIIWAVQYIPNIPPTPKGLIIALVILLGVLLIAEKAGLVAL